MTARGGGDPGERYAELTAVYGAPVYRRVDSPATPEQKRLLGEFTPEELTATELAGEPIDQVLTAAPSGAALGGLKVLAASGWFAARPSGTENICKLYAESFVGEQHLDRILAEAQELLAP
jgi:phosphoglucomutase